jgi:hypothetical protein
MRSLLCLLCLVLLSTTPAWADAPAKAAPSKSKLDKIHVLLHQLGADKMANNILETLRTQLPPDRLQKVSKLIDNNELMELLVPIYDRHFSEDEIEGLIGFYNTPLGQRLVQETPGISQESVVVLSNYARAKLQAQAMPSANSVTHVPSDVPLANPH